MNPPDGKWCVATIGDDRKPWTAFKWGDITDRSVNDFRTWQQAFDHATMQASREARVRALANDPFTVAFVDSINRHVCDQSHWGLRA